MILSSFVKEPEGCLQACSLQTDVELNSLLFKLEIRKRQLDALETYHC